MNAGNSASLSERVLIYDGQCSLCLRSVEWIRKRLEDEAPEFLAARDPVVAQRFPDLREEALLEEMHLVGPDGEVLKGSRAVEEVLRRTPRWSWVGLLLALPVIRRLARRVYAWVADHRTALGCGEHCSLSEPKGTGGSTEAEALPAQTGEGGDRGP